MYIERCTGTTKGLIQRISNSIRPRAPRLVLAALFPCIVYALFGFYFSLQTINLGTSLFYFALVPMITAAVIAGFLWDRNDPTLSPKSLARFGLYSILAYSLYDWGRVPANFFFGLPFFADMFDWGQNITGAPNLSLASLTAGLLTHLLRGWGMAMAYYLLATRITLPSAIVFSGAMTFFYWGFFPFFVVAEAKPPLVWWLTAWEAHVLFGLGLYMAPKLFSNYLSGYRISKSNPIIGVTSKNSNG